jgi:hypothetical protein
MKRTSPTDKILVELRTYGLALPGAHLKSPWPGHKDLAVDDKTFAYMSLEGQPLGLGCKLPKSASVALMLPGATPMAYGLGKSGWVSMEFADPAGIDVAMCKAWIDESYRAQASKKRIKELDGVTPVKPAARSAKKAARGRAR